MSPRPERRRTGLLLQVGQTLLVLGAAVVVLGLVLHGGFSAVGVGVLIMVVGAVLLGVGLRRRGRQPEQPGRRP